MSKRNDQNYYITLNVLVPYWNSWVSENSDEMVSLMKEDSSKENMIVMLDTVFGVWLEDEDHVPGGAQGLLWLLVRLSRYNKYVRFPLTMPSLTRELVIYVLAEIGLDPMVRDRLIHGDTSSDLEDIFP